jgi:ATPase subunit of ABC transporter with duplicated ATPase domains
MGELEPDEGTSNGATTSRSYFPKDNTELLRRLHTESLVDWMRQFSEKKDDVYLRGFLGRMLFLRRRRVFKPVNVLSGGEKVRCMLSRMMLSGAT